MKIKLIKDTKITMKAGSIVDVPAPVYNNLVSLGAGVPVAGEAGTTTKRKRATKK